MENNQKTHKPKSAEKIQNSDRISSMHDAIIYHIFSFLPTLYVVRTSILSKRWHNLWNSLPYVYFDDKSFTDANEIEQPEEIIRIKFRDLVNNFMSRRVSSTMPIIKFRLSTHCLFDGSDINEWIGAATRAGVQELDVRIGDIEFQNNLEYRFPSCLFNCTSLVTLKLSIDDMMFHFPECFCFPNLKGMHLHAVILAKNFHHELMNCPNLEVLFLNRFSVDLDTLPSSNIFQDSTDEQHSKILSNLDNAFIDVAFKSRLIGEALQYSEACLLNHLPTFCNLKHLDLELGSDNGNMVEKGHGTLKPKEFLSISLPEKLKKITVDDFWGTEKQIEFVRLLFINELWEEIIVHLHSSAEDTILLREELLQFPRLSKLVLVYENSEEKVIEEIFPL
ncbi:hypothetical protein ACOSQ2_031001 [Xanthoceras sorbifolium]